MTAPNRSALVGTGYRGSASRCGLGARSRLLRRARSPARERLRMWRQECVGVRARRVEGARAQVWRITGKAKMRAARHQFPYRAVHLKDASRAAMDSAWKDIKSRPRQTGKPSTGISGGKSRTHRVGKGTLELTDKLPAFKVFLEPRRPVSQWADESRERTVRIGHRRRSLRRSASRR